MRRISPYVVGYLRLIRRRARLSQRELAQLAGISQSSVSRIESGQMVPSLRMFEDLLRLGGLRLAVVDVDRRERRPMLELPLTRDFGDRKWPAHLGLILDPGPGEWWGDRFGLVRPPETFRRDPAARQEHREVFHRLRGIGAYGEPRDWRERAARRPRWLAQRVGRGGGTVPGRAGDHDQGAGRAGGTGVDGGAGPGARAG